MTDAKHTPGPWEYVPGNENHGPYVTHEFGGTVADLYVMTKPTIVNPAPPRPVPFMAEQAEHNARLIAAAPELLEVLSWFISDIDGTHTVMVEFDANVERARTAIAKATGAA